MKDILSRFVPPVYTAHYKKSNLLFQPSIILGTEMKSVLALIILLFAVQSYPQSEWNWVNPTPIGGSNFYGCQYYKDFIYSAVYGGIVRSIDGGSSWKYFYVGDGANFHFFDHKIGIIGGNQGLYKTTDGGLTWTSIHGAKSILNHDERFGKVFMASEYSYYAAYSSGNGEYLKITYDGGATWQSKSFSNDYDWIYEISFSDTLNGVIASVRNLNRTFDGGATWVIQYPGTMRSVSMLDSLNYYAITNDVQSRTAMILKTTNGGSSFTIKSFDNSILERVDFITEDVAVAVGDTGLIMKTTNGGVSWFKQTSGVNYHLRHVSFTDSLNGIACGYNYNGNPINGIITTTDGGNTWISRCQSVTSYNLLDVSFADDYIGIAVGDSGTILRTSNSGLNWSKQSSGTTSKIIQVDMTNNKGIAYTSSGLILRTTDKGITWNQQLSGTNVRKVFFINDTIGMAINNNVVLKTTNGGRNWLIKVITDYSFSDIQMLDENKVFLIGQRSDLPPVVIMKSTNGGTTWSSHFYGGEYRQALDVHFPDSLTGYITGYSYDPTEYFNRAFVWKTSDGGATWFGVAGFYNGTLSSIHFLNSNVGVAIGSRLLKTTNGGATWENEFTGSLGRAFYINADRAVVVGREGLIITNNLTPVPVELNSFTASTEKNRIILNWSTATEINSKGFEVQRKKENFGFEILTFIDGNGTTSETKYYSFVDNNLEQGKYTYRLKQIDLDGSYEYSKEVEVNFNFFVEYSLSQCYPNPFNPTTKFNFTIAKEAKTSLIIYDVLGREIKTLFDEVKSPGVYEVEFNGAGLSSGIYFYKLSSDNYTDIKKMILMK